MQFNKLNVDLFSANYIFWIEICAKDCGQLKNAILDAFFKIGLNEIKMIAYSNRDWAVWRGTL